MSNSKIVNELRGWLLIHGYSEKRPLVFDKKILKTKLIGGQAAQVEERIYRYKVSAVMLRKEVQCVHEDGSKSWVRLASGYLKGISIVNDLIRGMKR